MNQIRRLVVAVLLAVWVFPALSQASPGRQAAPDGNAGRSPAVTETGASRTTTPAQRTQAAPTGEVQKLTEREQQTPDLQNFRGGGVSIYIGSGALLVTVIILLILLI